MQAKPGAALECTHMTENPYEPPKGEEKERMQIASNFGQSIVLGSMALLCGGLGAFGASRAYPLAFAFGIMALWSFVASLIKARKPPS